MNKLNYTFLLLLFFLSVDTFSQEIRNDKYQKIMIMDGENKDWLEIFVDPTNFGCECNDVIKLSLKPTNIKNVYKTEDNLVTLTIKEVKYVIKVEGEQDCCYGQV